jgi:hypothetical protein
VFIDIKYYYKVILYTMDLKKEIDELKQIYDYLLNTQQIYKNKKEYGKLMKEIFNLIQEKQLIICNYILEINGKTAKNTIKKVRGSYNKNNKFNTKYNENSDNCEIVLNKPNNDLVEFNNNYQIIKYPANFNY